MECQYDWNQNTLQATVDKKKRKINRRDLSFTTTFPTDQIKEEKFETSEQISTFLLRNAQSIGLVQWQIFEKAVIDKGDYIKIVYTCRKKYCEAVLVYHQKKLTNTTQL